MVAAKLKRSQDRILAYRPYAHKMRGVLEQFEPTRQSYPIPPPKAWGKKIEILVVTSDRGLCGGFNGNIVRKSAGFVRQCESQGLSVNLSLIGRKGEIIFAVVPLPIRQEWTGIFDKLSLSTPSTSAAISPKISSKDIRRTLRGVQRVQVCDSTARDCRKVFPIDAATEFGASQATEGSSLGGSYLYEPDEGEFERIGAQALSNSDYRILLESAAAEHGARMAAMDGATRNAGQLIKKVTLYYNKTRQAAITKELMDIVGGAEALK